MKMDRIRYFLVGAMAVLGLSVAAQATPVVVLLNNVGSTFTNGIRQDNVANPYGTQPMPNITTTTDSASITFTPSSFFIVKANDSIGTDNWVNGSFSFMVTFPSAVNLTTSLVESGTYQNNSGTSQVTATVGVTALNSAETAKYNTVQNNFNVPSTSTIAWSINNQFSPAFNDTYTTYLVAVDNVLEAVSTTSNTTTMDKKFFTITVSDGSGGGVPEPASLGVLAMGSLALMARRRRV
jgi:hypothetical protein